MCLVSVEPSRFDEISDKRGWLAIPLDPSLDSLVGVFSDVSLGCKAAGEVPDCFEPSECRAFGLGDERLEAGEFWMVRDSSEGHYGLATVLLNSAAFEHVAKWVIAGESSVSMGFMGICLPAGVVQNSMTWLQPRQLPLGCGLYPASAMAARFLGKGIALLLSANCSVAEWSKHRLVSC